MARVTLAAEIDAKLRRRIEIAAASSDKSVSEWIEQALVHELARERETPEDVEITLAEPGRKPLGISDPPRLKGE